MPKDLGQRACQSAALFAPPQQPSQPAPLAPFSLLLADQIITGSNCALRCSVTSRDVLQPQDPEPCGFVAAANPSLKPSNQKSTIYSRRSWRSDHPCLARKKLIGRADLEMRHE